MSIYESKGFAVLYASVPPALLAIALQFVDFTSLGLRGKAIFLLPVILYLYAAYKIGKAILGNLNNPLRQLPTPSGDSFLLGHARATWEEPRGNCFLRWIDEVPNEGLIYYAGFFRATPHVIVTSPDAIREVLVTRAYDYVKPDIGRKFLEQTTGRGLIVVEGDEHKMQRKSVAPAFSGKHVRDLVPVFWKKAKELADVLASQLDVVSEGDDERNTGVVELNMWASRATIDIICAATLGREFDSLRNSDNELALQYGRVFGEAGAQIWIIFDLLGAPPPLQLARWMPFFTKFRNAAEGRYQLRPLCRKLVEQKRQDIESGKDSQVDILSVLMQSGEFKDDGLVDQLLTFLAAGHETTSSAFAFTCWLLAKHPEIQKRLRDELKAHFTGVENISMTATDLDNLPYLDAVISEQLRLYPSAPISPRWSVRETSILGHHIPKDQFVLLCPWATNRSKKLWGEDAQEFRPERWLTKEGSENVKDADPMRFLTFFYGPRSCPGQAFSRLEQKCLVAALIMRFQIEMADEEEEISPRGFITVKPMGNNGLQLKLRELSQ
ncbi:Protein LUTEIN DEFICIENT 5, chloroplastic [Cercospora beticola]|uniref:Protein LUTEIN DEFICIENT 5, chloroplastic n=1 Tax=Cercospora beticola TaxID=122368 RepID=A0A2G5HJB5_CERBT|nr:Protein LUTEIN DEFICIENT 5, chloroplastic [Cercospora beticola]PIA92657.1 Protein LUTEIN DEFICIENT 5, chloroplastic [Cercospora beticola]WPB02390.1 hypothetical protein RHO25_007024 [Cercospora beticola]CAK1362724.1 unnamed protein product [Cercospora beticola]